METVTLNSCIAVTISTQSSVSDALIAVSSISKRADCTSQLSTTVVVPSTIYFEEQ